MSKQNPDVMQTAADWYVTLSSGKATSQQVQAWQAWLNAHPQHTQAWLKLENVTQQFSMIDSVTGMEVLSQPVKIKNKTSELSSHSRRQALKHLSILLVAGSTGWLTYEQKPWQTLMADYATETGKQQQVALQDGTKLFLNTNSLVAINYTTQERNIQLLKGEILIETAHEQSAVYRPLSVITEQGKLTALGTRFSVKVNDASNDLNVYEGAVSVQAVNSSRHIVVNAGEFMRFSAERYQAKTALDTSSDAWVKGFIVVDKMPLNTFIAEISRYKKGIIHFDHSIGQLEISGAFPINDIDSTLASVSKTLSLRIETFTRYWVTLNPA